jgi:hypothetical protein
MSILEERGLFWSNDVPIPANCFAPNTPSSGVLRIDDEGRTELELDGVLDNGRRLSSMLRRQEGETAGLFKVFSRQITIEYFF